MRLNRTSQVLKCIAQTFKDRHSVLLFSVAQLEWPMILCCTFRDAWAVFQNLRTLFRTASKFWNFLNSDCQWLHVYYYYYLDRLLSFLDMSYQQLYAFRRKTLSLWILNSPPKVQGCIVLLTSQIHNCTVMMTSHFIQKRNGSRLLHLRSIHDSGKFCLGSKINEWNGDEGCTLRLSNGKISRFLLNSRLRVWLGACITASARELNLLNNLHKKWRFFFILFVLCSDMLCHFKCWDSCLDYNGFLNCTILVWAEDS